MNPFLKEAAIRFAQIDSDGMITVIENASAMVYPKVKYPSELLLRTKIEEAKFVTLSSDYFRTSYDYGINFYDSDWHFMFSVPIQNDKIFNELQIKSIENTFEFRSG